MNTKFKLTITALMICVMLVAVLCACGGDNGAWNIMGVNESEIESITLVSGGGTLKVLTGDRLKQFIADFDALKLTKQDGYTDRNFDYAIRIALVGKEGYIEYKLGQELTLNGLSGGAKKGFYNLGDGYDEAKEMVRSYFYAI